MTQEDMELTNSEKELTAEKTTEDASAATAREKSTALSSRKKSNKKRMVFKGQAHIQCTYNNTMISVTDLSGGVLGWSSSGLLGFKGAKKSTPYAATQVVSDLMEKIRKFQVKELEVFVKGMGSGREASIRAFSNNGFTLTSIKDITPIPHNGCRPKRPRRV